MKSIHYIFVSLFFLFTISMATNASYTTVDQTTPSFTSEPVDTEIDLNATLTLSWSVSNSENTDYEIHMTRKENSTLVGNGEVRDGSIAIYLDHLFESEYEFSCKLIYSGGSLWSNVTITVVEPTTSTSVDSSDDGFISGYTLIIGLMAYPLIIWIRMRTAPRK